MTITKRPQAFVDLDGLAAYLALEATPALAIRFLVSVEKTLDRLAAMPGLGAPYESEHPRLKGVRHAPVRGFPNDYLFYTEQPTGGIELIRVVHAKRDLPSTL